MDFTMDFWLFCVYFINFSFWLVQIFTLLNVALSKTSFQSIFWLQIVSYSQPHPPPPMAVFTTRQEVFLTRGRKENHRLDPMDLKIYTLAKNPRLWLDSWQNLWIFAIIMPVTPISGFNSILLRINEWNVNESANRLYIYVPKVE